jgi:hypothetical protein
MSSSFPYSISAVLCKVPCAKLYLELGKVQIALLLFYVQTFGLFYPILFCFVFMCVDAYRVCCARSMRQWAGTPMR